MSLRKQSFKIMQTDNDDYCLSKETNIFYEVLMDDGGDDIGNILDQNIDLHNRIDQAHKSLLDDSITIENFRKDCDAMKELMQEILDCPFKDREQHSIMGKFYALLIIIRLDDILVTLNETSSIKTACKPYLAKIDNPRSKHKKREPNSNIYENFDLFSEKEKKLKTKMAISAVSFFKQWLEITVTVKDKASHIINPLLFILYLEPEPSLLDDDISYIFKLGISSIFKKKCENILSTDDWQEKLENILRVKSLVKHFGIYGVFQDVIMPMLVKIKDSDIFFINRMDFLNHLAEGIPTDHFFLFTKKLSNSNTTNYFKSMLLRGLNYKFCMKDVDEGIFKEYANFYTLIIYQALISGDHFTLDQLISLSSEQGNHHERKYKMISSYDYPELTINTEKLTVFKNAIHYTHKIPYQINQLIAYMLEIYEMADDTSTLYFIKNTYPLNLSPIDFQSHLLQ